MAKHPEEFAIGKTVVVQRRLGHSIDWQRAGHVVRHTKTSVIVAIFADHPTARFVAKRGGYHLVPRYLDYVTTLVPVPTGAPDDRQ